VDVPVRPEVSPSTSAAAPSPAPVTAPPSDAELGPSTTVLDPSRRIFTCRNLRFDQIKQIGFDMDYTLAPYVKRNIEELSFKMTAERMVEHLGYPEDILSIPYDPKFVVRGLAVDKRLGNILKMDGHNYVGRAYHGRTPLTKERRIELYRNQKIKLPTPRYYWLDTLFALPEATLYAGIIELYEQKLGIKKVAFAKLFEDIRESIDTCHRDGSLKKVIKSDLSRYIDVDPALPPTLHKLRSSGKRLFVLTNSLWDYTNEVMSFLLDGKLAEYPRWLNYFDVVVVGAGKPEFFTENREFRRVNPETGHTIDHPVMRFETRGVYQGGSIRRFDAMSPDESGDRILYVGDHMYGDIIRSKKDSLWRTALILEELESELAMSHEIQRKQLDLVTLEEHRARLDDETTNLKIRLSQVEQHLDDTQDPVRLEELNKTKRQLRFMLDRHRRDLKAVIARREELSLEIDKAYNPYWGSVFKEGPELSRFGEQVEDYACVYTSRVSNFLSYSPSQYFRAPRHWMAHEKS
jgi:5'-nucleotidase